VSTLFENDKENQLSDVENCESKAAARKRVGVPKDKARDIDWAEVATQMGNGRKSVDCLRRYNKITGNRGGEKPGALKGPWTAAEDNKIISLVHAHGAKKWSQIAAELPGEFRVQKPRLCIAYAFVSLL
jgi:hypothetical protein